MRRIAFLFLLAALALPALGSADAPPDFATMVSQRQEAAARELAARVLGTARALSGMDAGPKSLGAVVVDPEKGARLSGAMVFLSRPSEPLRAAGCAIFSTAPLKVQSSMTDCLVISSEDVKVASYLTGSVVVSQGELRVGSYGKANVVDAAVAGFGSGSRNSLYLGTRPSCGGDSEGDQVLDGPSLKALAGF